MNCPSLLGAVLAGGYSSRMGSDKPALKPWGAEGPSLLERAASLLRPLTAQYVVSCRPDQDYKGHTCIKDARPGQGPAQGLLACLEHAKKLELAATLIIGCDQPGLTSSLLERLIIAWQTAHAAHLAALFQNIVTGKLEMLTAIYSVDFIADLAQGLDQGERSLYRLVPKSRITILEYGPEEDAQFVNLNTPAQFEAFSKSQPPSDRRKVQR